MVIGGQFHLSRCHPTTLKLPKFSKSKGKKAFASCFYTPKSTSPTLHSSSVLERRRNIMSMVNKLSIIQSSLRDGGEPSPWVNQHSCWYCGKNPKIHLNYFYILQIFHAYTKSGSLSSNLTFWGLIWPLRGLAQKCESTTVGAGSPWLCTWPPRPTSPPSLCIQIHTLYLWTLSPHSTPTSIIHGFALQPYTCKFFGKGRGGTDSMNSISKLLHFAMWVVCPTSNIPYVTLLS